MKLSEYYQKYASLSDEEIRKRNQTKEDELVSIFEQIELQTENEIVQIAVLGSGERRLAEFHQEMFERVLDRPVNVTIFDLNTEHLAGVENVVVHNCTEPLPNPPYDITYAHVLLKFIETKEQWDLIWNSYDALAPGGIAIHILDREDYETTDEKLPDGYYSVSLEQWKKQLDEEEIDYVGISLKYGVALVLIK